MKGQQQSCFNNKRSIPKFKFCFFQTCLLVMIITGGKIYKPKHPEKEMPLQAMALFIRECEIMPVHRSYFLLMVLLFFHSYQTAGFVTIHESSSCLPLYLVNEYLDIE